MGSRSLEFVLVSSFAAHFCVFAVLFFLLQWFPTFSKEVNSNHVWFLWILHINVQGWKSHLAKKWRVPRTLPPLYWSKMDCAPKVCIAEINHEKLRRAGECVRTSAHLGLIRWRKRDEKKLPLDWKMEIALLFLCASLRTHVHFEKIKYESQNWRNACWGGCAGI